MSLSIQTPLLQSNKLSQLNQCQVWLKMESSQPTGSFKLRSIGRACESHAAQRKMPHALAVGLAIISR